jgi:single-strand DNA-binding protein
MSINSITIVGRLGGDPEIRTTQSGSTVTKFSLATDRYNGKERDKTTDWHRVVCFGQLAENCAKYLAKGRQAAVRGSMKYGSYEKDGVRHNTAEVMAEEVQFLGGGNGGGQAEGEFQPDAVAPNDMPF